MFWINKRMFDFCMLLLIPSIYYFNNLLFINILLIQEVYFLFRIVWVKIACFSAIKFRTMVPVKEITRKYDDPIEDE